MWPWRRRYVLMPMRDGRLQECRILRETKTHYLVRHTVTVLGLSFEDDDWIAKGDPRIAGTVP